MKNRAKIVLKNVYFFKLRFSRMFYDFFEFWLDFGRPGALKKLKKIEKNRFFNTFIFEGGFWEGSGRVLGRFRKDFEWIFERFWEDIWKDWREKQ